MPSTEPANVQTVQEATAINAAASLRDKIAELIPKFDRMACPTECLPDSWVFGCDDVQGRLREIVDELQSTITDIKNGRARE